MSDYIGANSRLAAWERPLWNCLFAAVCVLALWLRLTNPPVTKRSPDEHYYTYYAEQVLHAPLEAPRNLVSRYNHASGSWTYPIPLRVAHYYSVAGIMAIFRIGAEPAGVALSTACSILQFACVAVVGLRLFGRWPTLCALAMLTVSPEDLAMARRDWGDSVSAAVAMLLILLGVEIIRRPRPTAWFVAFCVAGTYLVLVKETGGIFFGLCVLGLAIHSWLMHRSWRRLAAIGLYAILSAACAFLIMTTLCGGVSAALETIHHSAQAVSASTFGIMYQEGPWYSIVQALFCLSPISVLFAGVAAASCLFSRKANQIEEVLSFDRRNRYVGIALAAIVVLIIAAITMAPALKNLRYISFVLGPFYLLAGLGLAYLPALLLRSRQRRFFLPVALLFAAGLTISCALDYLQFRHVFVQSNVNDLDIRQIIDFSGNRYGFH